MSHAGSSSTALQRKIFSRWVRQKVARRDVQVNDVVTDFSTGLLLVDLIEELSEKKIDKKLSRPPKMRVQNVDNCKNALDFTWACGVQLELKPSAENLVDGNEKQILGLVWGIMRKYLKFGDDVDEKLNAQDALLMWVQNQTSGYKGVDVKDFGKSFQDGLALCALIHKFRPKLLDYESLDPSDKLGNLKKAFDAAEKYFGLEQYLQPSDIAHLDDKSMVIYVSEYYYGIANQRKLDLAGRRISKLIQFTKDNDAMKKEYTERAGKLRERLDRVGKVLNDRTIDNTLAGAKKKIQEFQDYKKNDKGVILTDFLGLESLYNHLAMRLADHKRPEFAPGAGLTVKDLRQALNDLEKIEQERAVALNAELNRQNRLVLLNDQHVTNYEKLYKWQADKSNYLCHKEVVESSGAAEYHLNALATYENECEAVKNSNHADLKRLGVELVKEKYENASSVQSREEKISGAFELLTKYANEKHTILTDDLERNKYKERFHVQNKSHLSQFQKYQAWIKEKEAFLEKKETIGSITDAQEALAVLEAYEKEKLNFVQTSVPPFKALGQAVLDAKYQSKHSSWSFENPKDITDRHASIDESLVRLDAASAVKKQVLDSALQLELKKEKARLNVANVAGDLALWAKNVADTLAAAQFGFTLEEVEAYADVVKKTDAENNSTCASKRAAAEAGFNELKELHVEENIYTKLTLADVAAAAGLVADAQSARNKRYDAELARQRANDALCRKFAEASRPVTEAIVVNKDKITNSQAELAAQLEFVRAQLADQTLKNSLPEVKSLQDQIDAAGVSYNKHSHLSANDVVIQYEQYEEFLNRKAKMLEEEIEHKKLRGITKQQFEEIEAQFKQFDKNQSGKLDKKEFKACLYSLGEERSAQEIADIIKKYGDNDGQVTHEGFRNFMIDLLGDTDTKDEIQAGFKLINRGAEVGKQDLLELILPEQDVVYLKDTAKAVDGGLDYKTWTETVFSR